MSTLMCKIAILVMTCLAFEIRASNIKNISKSHDFPKSLVYINKEDIIGSSLLYVVCEKTNIQSEKKCKVIFETNTHEVDRSCNITLKSEDENGEIDNFSIKVILLNPNKAVLLWMDESKKLTKHFMKLSTVNLVSCQISEMKMAINMKKDENYFLFSSFVQPSIPTVVNNRTYDVIFENPELCGNKRCKVTFDADGTKVAGPIAWYPNITDEINLAPIESHSRSNGLLMVKYNLYADRAEVSLVQSDGLKVLKEYNIGDYFNDQGWIAVYSTAHETIGICTQANSTATCTQFDLDGKQKLKVKFEAKYKIIDSNVHNLPNGGYLLLTVGCPNSSCSKLGDHIYDLMKIDADGMHIRALKITEFKCRPGYDIFESKFFENDSNESCLSFVCVSETGEHLNFFSKCFSDNEFCN